MIDPTTQLATMIRAQLRAQFQAQSRTHDTALRETARGRASLSDDDRSNTLEPGGADAQVQRMVAVRVRALSPDDPQRQRKAFRLFLESLLLQTLGRDRIDGHALDQLVDTVMQRMEADAELQTAMREAGDFLLADAVATRPGVPGAPVAR